MVAEEKVRLIIYRKKCQETNGCADLSITNQNYLG